MQGQRLTCQKVPVESQSSRMPRGAGYFPANQRVTPSRLIRFAQAFRLPLRFIKIPRTGQNFRSLSMTVTHVPTAADEIFGSRKGTKHLCASSYKCLVNAPKFDSLKRPSMASAIALKVT